MTSSPATGRALLDHVRIPTDELSVDDRGVLVIEGCAADELIAEHGSPLFVLSEATLRTNARRVVGAFAGRWPAPVNVMFAIKANNNIAVRRVMTDVGLGGDCFSAGEVHATLSGGADPAKVALNGSNKSLAAVGQAITTGMVVNLDSRPDLDLVLEVARSLGQRARVAVRLRLTSQDYLRSRAEDPDLPDIVDFIDTEQVGSSEAAAAELLADALLEDDVQVVGYHFHLGRLSRRPSYHRWWSAGVGRVVVDLHARFGFTPQVLNVGGGYAREREPESGDAPLLNEHTIEEYAETVTGELRRALTAAGLALPELWLEPGRYIAGNAGILLSTVGTVKADVGMTWVNVDASINDLPRVENARWDHVALPADRMDDPTGPPVDVVGSLCVGRHLKTATRLPELRRGDLVAFLDAGAYAETASTQYNAVPRPATVLVTGGRSAVVKRRETVEDLFRTHHVPDHLLAGVAQPAGPTTHPNLEEPA